MNIGHDYTSQEINFINMLWENDYLKKDDIAQDIHFANLNDKQQKAMNPEQHWDEVGLPSLTHLV